MAEFDDRLFAVPEERVVRYTAIYNGTVISNVDPRNLGRVRVKIHGLIDESKPAFPATAGGGSDGRGAFFVPEVGADVFVAFLRGNLDEPIYWGGHWGGDERAPGPEGNITPEERPVVSAIETDRHIILLDARAGSPTISLADKVSGARVTIENDAIIFHGYRLSAGFDAVADISARTIDLNAGDDIDMSAAMISGGAEEISLTASGVAAVDGLRVELGGGGPPVGRVGDRVEVTIPVGTVHVTNPAGVPPTIPNPLPILLSGVIVTGSPKVTSG